MGKLCKVSSLIKCLQAATLEDLKFIIGKLSKLRSEMQTNKTLHQFETCSSHLEDCERWNKELNETKESAAPCWFNSPWLLVECYMYRVIYAIFEDRYLHLNLQT